MDYKRLTLVKKSVYDVIYDSINDSDYTVGDGVGQVRLSMAFPEIDEEGNYLDLILPAVAIDFSKEGPKEAIDLGVQYAHVFDMEVNIFARNDLEREYLLSVMKDTIELGSIPYKDYNSTTEATPTVSYLRSLDESIEPIRVDTPGEKEKFRGVMFFSLVLPEDH